MEIYKVPFCIITSERLNYFCTHKGMVMVKKNIVGNTKEIMTGFNTFFNPQDFSYNDSNTRNLRYIIKNIKAHYLKDIIEKYGFALALESQSFKLATLQDVQKWKRDFENSEFYKYYQQLNNFSQKPKEKVKSINKRRLNGQF